MASLRTALDALAVTGPVRIPGDFASCPRSLRRAMRAMLTDPRPEWWTQASEQHIDEDWTDEVQGIAHDGNHFYFSTNTNALKPDALRAIYRYEGGDEVELVLDLGDDRYGEHIGGIDWFDGILYAAMEQPPGVLMVSPTGDGGAFSSKEPLKGASGGAPPQGSELPWCAVNPWNGLLYSSNFGGLEGPGIDIVYAYGDDFRHQPQADLHLSRRVQRVQGGCFSDQGHLYLASDRPIPAAPRNKGIVAFSAFTGRYLGTAKVLALEDEEELQDLCYTNTSWPIHVVLLENVYSLATDNIFFKHFTAPDPTQV